MDTQIVSATEFKAKCLAMLEAVSKTGGTIIVTKRGKPLAAIGPAPKRPWKSPEGIWAGKVNIPDEVLLADTSGDWDALRGVDPA